MFSLSDNQNSSILRNTLGTFAKRHFRYKINEAILLLGRHSFCRPYKRSSNMKLYRCCCQRKSWLCQIQANSNEIKMNGRNDHLVFKFAQREGLLFCSTLKECFFKVFGQAPDFFIEQICEDKDVSKGFSSFHKN